MRIGIISDTRSSNGDEIPQEVFKAFEGVDLILHAGGIHTPEVLDALEKLAPVRAVGRTDGDRTEGAKNFSMECAGDPRVAHLQDVLDIAGRKVGLINGLWLRRFSDDVFPGVIERSSTIKPGDISNMVEEVFEQPVDIVVFGRTLYSMVETHDGILFVNPGSPSLPRNLRRLGNVAILEIMDDSTVANVLDLRDLS
ncbi:MAG: metallophosphoesterase family protein [SAR202 cluster bacterium]|nr:metallophosphoesterase family protein [SAR202 cluster bacterium]|tara:strand:- start:5688 stop:6278 length:591 start_codon:yes stop_codon:yes gene_type:complete